jgi:uncharacterized membrane protein
VTDRRLRSASLALTVAGLSVAGYLTYVHYADITPVCAISHGCETVQRSHYAMLAGVPVALLGLVGYALIGAALVIDGPRGRAAAAVAAIAGCAFSVYLTCLELAVIHAICQWCAASAVFMTVLAVLTGIRFVAVEEPVDHNDGGGGAAPRATQAGPEALAPGAPDAARGEPH